jgi:membrane-associated phospholipid phosphatase
VAPGGCDRIEDSMSSSAKRTVSFAIVIALVALSYEWLDRPIAVYVHAEFHGVKTLPWLTFIPECLAVLAVVTFIVMGWRVAIGHHLSKFDSVLLVCGVSLTVGAAIKDQLKLGFGRTWPETWINGNPSLIRNNVYGFNPFHGGIGYASFPSGHTTMICAVASVLWICYPKFRTIYVLMVAAVAIGLIGADYHFLSDVIAGGFLGISVGWMTVSFWERAERVLRPTTAPVGPKGLVEGCGSIQSATGDTFATPAVDHSGPHHTAH